MTNAAALADAGKLIEKTCDECGNTFKIPA